MIRHGPSFASENTFLSFPLFNKKQVLLRVAGLSFRVVLEENDVDLRSELDEAFQGADLSGHSDPLLFGRSEFGLEERFALFLVAREDQAGIFEAQLAQCANQPDTGIEIGRAHV